MYLIEHNRVRERKKYKKIQRQVIEHNRVREIYKNIQRHVIGHNRVREMEGDIKRNKEKIYVETKQKETE